MQAGLSAEKASAALAFDRAASFYRHALDLAPSADRVPAWREALAAALANAARPAEAADEYLRAAEGATRARRVELQRRAAEQFLTGGHIDQGLDLIRSVLASVGVTFRAQSARRPRFVSCGGACGCGGAALDSCRGRPARSMPTRCCGWIPAGPRHRVWRWST